VVWKVVTLQLQSYHLSQKILYYYILALKRHYDHVLHTLCTGKAGEMIDRGDNTYGGKYVINPSGGLISKGHPLGATGTLRFVHLL